MNQMALEFTAKARRRDPDTSHDAASKVGGQLLCELVMLDLRKNGPGTAHEIAERMGVSLVTISPRMKPLEVAGKVIRCGKRDGRTVWVPRIA